MKWFLLLLMSSTLIAAEDKVCHKCQVIREYNAAHPENNFEYYDDYLKEKNPNANQEPKKNEKLACGKCGCKDFLSRCTKESMQMACGKCKGKGKSKNGGKLACDKCKGKSKDSNIAAKSRESDEESRIACDKCKGKSKDSTI